MRVGAGRWYVWQHHAMPSCRLRLLALFVLRLALLLVAAVLRAEFLLQVEESLPDSKPLLIIYNRSMEGLL